MSRCYDERDGCKVKLVSCYDKYKHKYHALTKYEELQFDIILFELADTILHHTFSWVHELVYADMIYNILMDKFHENKFHIKVLESYYVTLEEECDTEDRDIFETFIKIDQENGLNLKIINILQAYICYRCMRQTRKLPHSLQNVTSYTLEDLGGYPLVYMKWFLQNHLVLDRSFSQVSVSLQHGIIGALKKFMIDKLKTKISEGLLEKSVVNDELDVYYRILTDEIESQSRMSGGSIDMESLYMSVVQKIEDIE